MARDIMTGQVQNTEVSAVSVQNKAATDVSSAKTDRQHVLAGALPAWDLVPRDQFIRRVK